MKRFALHIIEICIAPKESLRTFNSLHIFRDQLGLGIVLVMLLVLSFGIILRETNSIGWQDGKLILTYQDPMPNVGLDPFNSDNIFISPDSAESVMRGARASASWTADMVYWLDARDLDGDGIAEGIAGESGQSGGQVSAWTNKLGAGDFTNTAGSSPGTLPDFKEDQFNFNPAIDFNESVLTDYLAADVTDFPNTSLTQFLVMKTSSSGDGILSYATAGSDNEFLVFSQNALQVWVNDVVGEKPLNILNDDAVHLLSLDRNSSVLNVFQDGLANSSNAYAVNAGVLTSTGTIILAQDQDNIGGGFQTSQAYEGLLAEIITYSKVLSSEERQSVESYLAIKYGITLDQTSGTDYLASNQVTVWDYSENTAYTNDIAGIGRDDDSDLDQPKSKSENVDAILTIELAGSITNGHFFIWSNNNGSTSNTTTTVINDAGVDVNFDKMDRQWRIQEKNFIDAGGGIGTIADTGGGQMDASFDLTGLTYVTNEVRLLISNDDFTTASVSGVLPTFNGDIAKFEDVDLSDGQFISLALSLDNSPGGVSANLLYWIKANQGTVGSTITAWNDQSGNAVSNTVSGSPTFLDGVLNFNPIVRFDGVGDYITSNLNVNAAIHPDLSVFSVYTSHIDGAGGVWGEDDGDWDRFILDDNAFPHIMNAVSDGTLSQSGISGLYQPMIPVVSTVMFDEDQNNGSFVYTGGELASTFTSNHGPESSNNFQVGDIGTGGNGNYEFDGDIPELIVYGALPTTEERVRIESYLGIKYGLALSTDDDGDGTLGESLGSFTEGDYLSSTATVIWDYSQNITYHNDVAGIGRDDFSGLIQKQSQSSNGSSIVTIGLGDIAIDNNSNTNEFASDQVFMVWGHDNDFIDQANANVGDVPNNVGERLERIWRVDVTGEITNLSVSFDLTGLGYGSNLSDFKLVIADNSSNGIMADATTVMASTLVKSVVTFTGISFIDGQYFTLGTTINPNPGGVGNDLGLWLKANSEVYSDAGLTLATNGNSVQQWNDVSVNQNNAGQTDVAKKPLLRTAAINFNPTIDFDGDDDAITGAAGGYMNEVFLVVIPHDEVNKDLPSQAIYLVDHDQESYAGLFFGSATVGYNDELISVFGGSNGLQDWRRGHIDAMSSHAADVPFIISFNNDNSTESTEIYKNNERIDNASANTWNALDADENYVIGASEVSTSTFFDGEVAEIINYETKKGTTDREQIHSYLAIKYGVTLDQGVGTDYLNSIGSAVWNYSENTTYIYDIAGIGRDDNSALNQKQSKSINSDAIVTIGLDNDISPDGLETTNVLNDGSFSTDRSFLIWSNDGAGIDEGEGNEEFDRSTGINSRLNREWRIQETGTVGIVTVEIDVSSIAGPTGIGTNDESQIQLLVDEDGDFSGGSQTLISQVLVSPDDGVVKFRVDFTDGNYFTLVSAEQIALSVELVSFTGKAQPDHIMLEWATTSESNGTAFRLERATADMDFQAIAIIEGQATATGFKSYIYRDIEPIRGDNYYRLIDVDDHGIEAYSEIIRVNYIQKVRISQLVYPNPVSRGELLHFDLEVQASKGMLVFLADAYGRKLKPKLSADLANRHWTLATTDLKPGLYFLRIISRDGSINRQSKFMVKD